MLTERDWRVIHFVRKVGAANTHQLTDIFFHQNPTICWRRMREIIRHKKLQRTRAHLNAPYIYYKNKGHLEHKLLIAEFYRHLKLQQGEYWIIYFEPGCEREGLIADAYFKIYHKKQELPYFLEIERGTKRFNSEKYETYYCLNKYCPPIVVVGKKPLTDTIVDIRYLEDLSCLKKVLL